MISFKQKIKLLTVMSLLLVLTTCASSPYTVIESSNQNSRINYLVIHGTSGDFAESLHLLTQPSSNPVSSHYLIPSEEDSSHTESNNIIYNLVPEQRRAWHAGASYWRGEEALNNRSIGIELVNEFKCFEGIGAEAEQILPVTNCTFPPFPEQQIQRLIDLIHDVLLRNPEIDPIDIVAHSDIAVVRKVDPGPLFPWFQLYEQGIGAWPEHDRVLHYRSLFQDDRPTVGKIQEALASYGYRVDVSYEMDSQTGFVLRAFQLHFRPSNYSGELDVETVAILWALLEKYRPESLNRLMS